MSRRFVLNTVWTTGDVMPFLRLGSALRARGHEVTLVTHGHFEERARERDLGFEGIDAAEDYAAFAADVHLFANPQGFRAIYEKHVLPKVLAEVAALRRACGASRVGEPVVVTRSTPAIAARILRELDGVPFVPLFLAPSFVTSLPAVEALLGSVLAQAIDEVRATLGLGPVTHWPSWLATPKTSLGAWPAWFGGELSVPRGLTQCGFFRELDRGESSRSSAPIEGDAPILITGGTGAYLDADFFEHTSRACELLGRPGLVLTTHDHLVPASLPPRVKRLSGYVDFAELMPRTAAIAHHGGIGTLADALAAGRPQLAMGVGGDRPENAERLAALGVGAFLPPAKWSARAVADALENLLGSASVAERCRELRAATLGADPYGVACQILETARLDSSVTEPPKEAPGDAQPPSRRGVLAAAVSSLSAAKRVLLDRRLAQKRAAEGPRSIRRAGRDAPLSLSFSQERLWILDQIEPGTSVYNMPASIRLRGRVDVEAMRRAFELVVERHEVLRTGYRAEGGAPVQIVAPPVPFELPVEDIRSDRIRERAREEAEVAFDLSRPPLLRARLLRVENENADAPSEHVLLFTTHHIASDGWSTAILFSELAAFYDALSRDEGEPTLRPLPLQYADYAAWQREELGGEAGARKLAFFRDLLEDPPSLELPLDRPRPARQRYLGAAHTEDLAPGTARAVASLKREESLTLYMILLSAFAVLLERLSGDADVVIGSPVANRGRPEIDDLIGLFVNTIALRVDTSDNPTWRQLFTRIKDLVLRAHAHQDVPFERVVAAVAPERTQDRAPLFQVLFAVQNTPSRPIVLSDLELVPLTFETTSSKFDLSLYVYEEGDRLSTSWEFDTDLFDRSTVERFARSYARLVETLGRSPDAHVHACDVMDVDERAALLLAARGVEPVWPDEDTLASLFEARAAAAPEAPAFVCGDVTITYAEVKRRVDHLASELVSRGTRAGAFVGICLPRSVDAVVASLAAMSVGAAFVPLDPVYPASRLTLMAQDARLSVVVADAEREGLAAAFAPEVVRVDRRRAITAASARRAVRPDGAAYVVYTSGSTGRPKGVVGTHRATTNRLRWMAETFPFVAGDVCVLKTSINFVDAIAETFGPLLAGVPSLVLDDDVAKDPVALVGALEGARVTRIVVVPSLLRVILEVPDVRRRLEALRLWVTSGEALPEALAAEFFEVMPDAKLLNLYGSSEAAGDSTYSNVTRDVPVTLGRPIAHTRAYVLDSRMRLASRGAVGDLWLGGRGLARGYLNDAAMTSERFVPDPFDDAGARLYRTGDRVRLAASGELVFLGRVDQRVKLRGVRVEIGEIVATLRGLDGVADALVVLSTPSGAGTEMLIAYVVPKPGSNAPEAWKAALRRTLPDAMVPSVIVVLDAFPLTPNGKIDRQALRARSDVGATSGRVPSTSAERVVAKIWCAVLGRPKVFADEDFFAVGGNSLSGVMVINRLRETFRTDVPTRAIFERPTVERLVEALVEAWEGKPDIVEEIATLTLEVDALSDDEVNARLRG